jgi:hypothetical protein
MAGTAGGASAEQRRPHTALPRVPDVVVQGDPRSAPPDAGGRRHSRDDRRPGRRDTQAANRRSTVPPQPACTPRCAPATRARSTVLCRLLSSERRMPRTLVPIGLRDNSWIPASARSAPPAHCPPDKLREHPRCLRARATPTSTTHNSAWWLMTTFSAAEPRCVTGASGSATWTASGTPRRAASAYAPARSRHTFRTPGSRRSHTPTVSAARSCSNFRGRCASMYRARASRRPGAAVLSG